MTQKLPSGTELTDGDVAYPKEQQKHARLRMLIHSTEPLGLPKGSVRALITLFAMLGYTVAVGFAMAQGVTVPESLTSIVITIVAFYFGTRSGGTEQIREIEGNEITTNTLGSADSVTTQHNTSGDMQPTISVK